MGKRTSIIEKSKKEISTKITDTYYDGTKLLSINDVNGAKPEIYICTTNRTGGKTTYFGRLLVNRFLRTGAKFMLLYRFKYELDNVADKFFKDIKGLFFPTHNMESKTGTKGVYSLLTLDDNPCGYAVAINGADAIKKLSHLFSDVSAILFDEFQPENNVYCSNEIEKFISVHTSVARGQGKMWRYVPVYMLGNPITITNPYYIELGLAERLDAKTRFLRGNGFVMEQGYVESAANAQLESGFNQAFKSANYHQNAFGHENIYLHDNLAFIDSPEGKSRYVCTLLYEGCDYAIREYPMSGFVYCDTNPDYTYPLKISVTTDDHKLNYVMLNKSDYVLADLIYLFNKGCFRFKNMKCKEAILRALSYKNH